MDTQFEQQYKQLSRQYSVPDYLTPVSKLIFLLESPHVQELKQGVPVAGSSGVTMSKHLFGQSYGKLPLGLLLKKHQAERSDQFSLKTIGLMNVCSIPMQRAAYKSAEITQQYDEFLGILEAIRTANTKSAYQQPDWNEVQEFLIKGLRKRMATLTDRDCVWVPCGRFAQKFFKLAGMLPMHWRVIDDVPHPSYNSWDRENYRSIINRVKAEFERLTEQGAD
ncbi:MAG: hypothetical protein JWN30_326 [Bacilli bacterium]|nr:hypothetical protein [Bacilli bacterium]